MIDLQVINKHLLNKNNSKNVKHDTLFLINTHIYTHTKVIQSNTK